MEDGSKQKHRAGRKNLSQIRISANRGAQCRRITIWPAITLPGRQALILELTGLTGCMYM